jgi:hypothetical protein
MWRANIPLLSAMVICVGGCDSHVERQVDRQYGQLFDGGRSLLIAVKKYREGTGSWPDSPEQLRMSKVPFQIAGLDRYENLRFEALSNGDLVLRFDRWTSPRGDAVYSGGRIKVRPG